MRRTYKSKKDTGGGIDHRDVILTLDEKSSAFDAFYIQNIKQTKREISCMGASNHHGAASTKIRKRKYVKRIVKEVEPIVRKSISDSVFLTPDMSMRVNKAPDPFDLLLNSSPAIFEPKLVKKDSFEQLVDRPQKKYSRKKLSSIKKKYYSSSDNIESDKENTEKDKVNETQNVSDIRTHKFLIEKESSSRPKFDESVKEIVKNLSLLRDLNRRSCNNSFAKVFRYNKNRLTMNIQSPMSQTSPLSSTPFADKHRTKSIYKFSPIPMGDLEESPNYVTVMEDNNDQNGSIVFASKSNNVQNEENSGNIKSSPVTHLNSMKFQVNSSRSLFTSTDTEPQVSLPNSSKNCETEGKDMVDVKNKETSEIEICYMQTSEAEPFLGFSIDKLGIVPEADQLFIEDKENSIVFIVKSTKGSKETSDLKVDSLEAKESDENQDNNIRKENSAVSTLEHTKSCEPVLDFTKDKTDSNISLKSDVENLSNSVHIVNNTSVENTSLESEKESLYDTCAGESSFLEEEDIVREPLVRIKRMNNSLLQKYIAEMADYASPNEDSHGDNNTTKCSDYPSFDSFDLTDTSLNIEEELNETKQNDEESETKCPEDLTSNEEDLNCTSDYEETDTTMSSISKEDSNNYDNEDRCVSFVTTRRRYETTNNATILVLDDSYASPSSSDCDKTVLSNKVNLHEDTVLNVETVTNIDTEDKEVSYLENDMTITAANVKSKTSFVKPDTTVTTQNIKHIEPRTSSSRKSSKLRDSHIICRSPESKNAMEPVIVLQPGKKWERSLSIYRRMTMVTDHFDVSVLEDEALHKKGRKYRQSVIDTMELQESFGPLHNESINSCKSSILSKPSRSTIRIVKESNSSRISLCNTTVFDDLKGFLEDCDDTVIELSKLSIADSEHDVTVVEKFHDSNRVATAKDYVLRRCNQTDAILFDECYPDPVLKHCRKIGEGVYGEVFLWRAPDGRARVMKIVPIAGVTKVNGEHQKDFHEIISEIVIAMELSALRAPIAQIECHFDEGKDVDALDLHCVENATDVFNEVLAVRCVYGSYPLRLLDLWDLYDESKGSENDNPAILPVDQQYIVLELANAGQDLESYQFNSAEQAHALFLQVAFGLAVGEEAFQFEHRDLHWGNVLIAPTEQKYATFVLRGRAHRVPRRGVAATIIDYSLSRLSLPLARDSAALYNDLASDETLFGAVGDYQFEVYRLMRDKLGNDWKNFEPYTNILWLHYTVDKMITALRYKRTNTKTHKQYIAKLKGLKERILSYGSAVQFVLTDNEY